ncbi:uncharacterized protein LOC116967572 [Amblyraja radiata]|uniref:uncharacterized protein LOC116967572 n=1 Tax=Amblyraja radiata TaxID=386614 RepID=UPI00140246FE|nr:uncharacterized protein LOC116967572 [Amblyraja radiata]
MLFDIRNPPKRLSSQRRLLKRTNENLQSSPTPLKQQRVPHNIQTEQSYCSAADKVPREEPSSVSTTPETPDLQITQNVNDSRALKKERQRTFRLKKKVQLIKLSMGKNTTESKTISDLIRGAGEFLQEPALSFFASQLRNASGRRSARGRRWSYSDKVVALSLYHQRPRAYQFCQCILTLPSISSLRRWLCNIEVRPWVSP